jgi:hypothetical protein
MYDLMLFLSSIKMEAMLQSVQHRLLGRFKVYEFQVSFLEIIYYISDQFNTEVWLIEL